MEVCSATTYKAVKLAAEKEKVWCFTGDVVDMVGSHHMYFFLCGVGLWGHNVCHAQIVHSYRA